MAKKYSYLLLEFIKRSSVFAIWLFALTPLNAENIEIKSFGHSSFHIKGGGYSVLLNPFKSVGCAEGLKEPNVFPDIVLASSEFVDEGYWPKDGVMFVRPGSYLIDGLKLEGFASFHDRFGGNRFGYGTYWQWNQGGINFAHLAGIAGTLDFQDKLNLGRPDVLFIGVGGGAKVYSGKEAAEVIEHLNPKIVIPAQYLSNIFSVRKDADCDQTGIQPFLDATKHIEHRKVGKKYVLPRILENRTIIKLMY